MKMTYTKSAYEMPDGKYIARFTGVTMREATGQLDQRGNPMPPGMTWDFEITEGDQKGKKADRLTGRTPTPKSGCGKFLAAITDSVLRDGQEVDLEPFQGRLYRITIQENRISDNPTPVLIHEGTPTGPPSRPPSAGSATSTTAKYWVDLGSGQMNEAALDAPAVEHLLQSKGLNAETPCCQDGTNEWKPASAFGIKTAF